MNCLLRNMGQCKFYMEGKPLTLTLKTPCSTQGFCGWICRMIIFVEYMEYTSENFQIKLQNAQLYILVTLSTFCLLLSISRQQQVTMKVLLYFDIYRLSHFSYSCKMWYSLNLVLENCKYLLIC